jgi:hypothetical protein
MHCLGETSAGPLQILLCREARRFFFLGGGGMIDYNFETVGGGETESSLTKTIFFKCCIYIY